MTKVCRLSLMIFLTVATSCEKSGPALATQRSDAGSKETTATGSQSLHDITIDDLLESPEKLALYEKGAGDIDEVNRILSNDGFFRKELMTDKGRYLLQLGLFDRGAGPENVAILSKDSGGKFVPMMVVPIKVKSTPSLYEKGGKLLINFKQETDWGAEVAIVDGGLKFKGFEE